MCDCCAVVWGELCCDFDCVSDMWFLSVFMGVGRRLCPMFVCLLFSCCLVSTVDVPFVYCVVGCWYWCGCFVFVCCCVVWVYVWRASLFYGCVVVVVSACV